MPTLFSLPGTRCRWSRGQSSATRLADLETALLGNADSSRAL